MKGNIYSFILRMLEQFLF